MRWLPGLLPGPRWGSSRRSPRPLSRLGKGTPSPQSIPTPLGAFAASILAPSALSFCDPNVKSWLRPGCFRPGLSVINSRQLLLGAILNFFSKDFCSKTLWLYRPEARAGAGYSLPTGRSDVVITLLSVGDYQSEVFDVSNLPQRTPLADAF